LSPLGVPLSGAPTIPRSHAATARQQALDCKRGLSRGYAHAVSHLFVLCCGWGAMQPFHTWVPKSVGGCLRSDPQNIRCDAFDARRFQQRPVGSALPLAIPPHHHPFVHIAPAVHVVCRERVCECNSFCFAAPSAYACRSFFPCSHVVPSCGEGRESDAISSAHTLRRLSSRTSSWRPPPSPCDPRVHLRAGSHRTLSSPFALFSSSVPRAPTWSYAHSPLVISACNNSHRSPRALCKCVCDARVHVSLTTALPAVFLVLSCLVRHFIF
jgi:hypothetical protein